MEPLVRRLLFNEVDYLSMLAEMTGSPWEEDDEVLMASMNGDHPFFNEAIIKNGSRPPSSITLRTLERFYQDNDQPFMVHASCSSDPTLFRGTMASFGYRLTAVNTAMAVGGRSLLPPPRPAGVQLRPVTSTVDLTTFCRTASRGNELPPSLEDELVRLMEGIDPLSADRLTPFIAERDGVAVGTSVLMEGGDCGVYFVSTLPEERGRGIGAWITYETVRIGLVHGSVLALVEASPAGRSMYHRLGFYDFATVDEYIRP